jgi:hypothetical protein
MGWVLQTTMVKPPSCTPITQTSLGLSPQPLGGSIFPPSTLTLSRYVGVLVRPSPLRMLKMLSLP